MSFMWYATIKGMLFDDVALTLIDEFDVPALKNAYNGKVTINYSEEEISLPMYGKTTCFCYTIKGNGEKRVRKAKDALFQILKSHSQDSDPEDLLYQDGPVKL